MDKYSTEGRNPINNYKHALKVMRITLFLFFFSILLSQAATGYSQVVELSLNMKSTSIKEICEEIESNSEFRFIFSGSAKTIINKKINFSTNSQNINEILDNVLSNTHLKYIILENQVVIYYDNSKINPKEIEETVPELIIQQQKKHFTGKILDVNGEPIIGANIVEKGTSNGTVTDNDGNFAMNIENDAILLITYIGYLSQEANTAGKTAFNIILHEDTQSLEEVVVIGYGTVRRSDLTGAVSSVTERQFQDQPMTRLDEAINGRVPGVMMIVNSGAPDQNITVRIRGANSIYGGNDPLYVVDGVPNRNLFNNLDPSDIQSIEVLKDASATAIYGSRGANGVVLVTTKRGSEGKARIQFETQQSISTIAKQYELLSPYDYATQVNTIYNREEYTQAQLNAFQSGDSGIDWQDLMFRTSHNQSYRLNISGGNNNLRYLISGNYMDTQGILILSQMQRYSLRSNISADATNWLKVDFDINANRRTGSKNGPRGGVGGVIADAYTYSPTISMKDQDGNWNRDPYSSIQQNPYGRWTQDLDYNYTNFISNNLKLTFKLPVKGLTLNMQGSVNYSSGASFTMTSIANGLRESASSSSSSNSRNDSFSWYNMNQLNYNNKWGEHKIDATAVAEFTKTENGNLTASVHTLLTEASGYWDLGLGTPNTPTNSYTGSSMASFIGRAFYAYKDRYLITATIRQDGTSSFQTGQKWGTFPSAALSWIASEEGFLKDLNIFDMLKVRLTWGLTGNQGIGSYATLGLLTSANHDWSTGTNLTGYRVGNPPAKDLTWEKTSQFDLGFDLGFFRNRLNISLDVYQKNTYDLLLRKPIPYYNGGGDDLVNIGEVRNRGVDLALSGHIFQSSNMRWESMFNISYVKNTVLDLGGAEEILMGGTTNQMDIDPAILKVGEPMGSIRGWTWLGLWSTDEAAQAAEWGQSPGDNKFMSYTGNKQGGVYRLVPEDTRIIGKAFPDVTLGWNNTFSYKNWDLSFLLQGAFGADRINLARWFLNEQHSDAKMITGKEGWFNRWTPDNQNTKVPNPFSATIMSSPVSHQYLEKADYLRLRNISVSYALPKSLVKNIGDIRVSLSAQNIFTITKYTGLDPEGTMSTGGQVDTNAGVDGFSYPLPRTFTASLRFTF